MVVGFQEEDQLDDATRAFDDLRAEVAVLRRAVEALGPALKEHRLPDYSLSLGQIAKTQARVSRPSRVTGTPAGLRLLEEHEVSHAETRARVNPIPREFREFEPVLLGCE